MHYFRRWDNNISQILPSIGRGNVDVQCSPDLLRPEPGPLVFTNAVRPVLKYMKSLRAKIIDSIYDFWIRHPDKMECRWLSALFVLNLDKSISDPVKILNLLDWKISSSRYGQIADKPEASIFKRNGKPNKETRGVKTCNPLDPTVLQRITKMVNIRLKIGQTINRPDFST